MEIVRPKRSSVYLRLSRAVVSRYGSAAGEISAMKSSISQCSLAKARRTSASVFDRMRSVVSSQDIFSNSSLNMFFSIP